MDTITLPPPDLKGGITLTEAIANRRSIREFRPPALSLSELSQLLWSAQGITEPSWGLRAVPSAGATYPLEIYAVCGQDGVEGIDAGLYHYEVDSHSLKLHHKGDLRAELAGVALGEEGIIQAPVSLVICAEYERTMDRYGERGQRYVHMEVGHAGQNIYLQATALGLDTFAIGAFYDEQVRTVLRLDKRYRPLYIMPVGRPA